MDQVPASKFTVADLRKERGETLEQFARALGIASKGRLSEIERGADCSMPLALKLEAISGKRLDAAALSPAVAAARALPAAA